LQFTIYAVAFLAVMVVLAANFTAAGARASAVLDTFLNEHTYAIAGSVMACVAAFAAWAYISERKSTPQG